jgi:hypothetical protein
MAFHVSLCGLRSQCSPVTAYSCRQLYNSMEMVWLLSYKNCLLVCTWQAYSLCQTIRKSRFTAGRVAQAVEYLPNKHKTRSSNFSTTHTHIHTHTQGHEVRSTCGDNSRVQNHSHSGDYWNPNLTVLGHAMTVAPVYFLSLVFGFLINCAIPQWPLKTFLLKLADSSAYCVDRTPLTPHNPTFM